MDADATILALQVAAGVVQLATLVIVRTVHRNTSMRPPSMPEPFCRSCGHVYAMHGAARMKGGGGCVFPSCECTAFEQDNP
jgi:hypothetical protein